MAYKKKKENFNKKPLIKVIVFGANGLIGNEFCRKLDKKIFKLYKFSKNQCDITDLNDIKLKINNILPSFIINAAAYTDVDKAEKNKTTCLKINAKSLNNISKLAKKYNAWLIHFSTDYIFDGSKNLYYREIDKPRPLSIYGTSKLISEEEIIKSNCKYLIFRISWIYGNNNKNFPKTIINKLQTEENINVINDQYGAPTSANFICNSIIKCMKTILLKKNQYQFIGIYNLSSKGKTNWYEIAKFIKNHIITNKIFLTTTKITPIKTSKYKVEAVRPNNSLLYKRKIYNKFKIKSVFWKKDLKKFINDIHDS